MGSLIIALQGTAQAQRVYQRTLNVLQNNVANVNTPGYAAQSPTFLNQPFNPAEGLPGGIGFGDLQNSRSSYAEQSVQTQQSDLSRNQQLSTDLQQLNATFDLNSTSSVPETLSKFFNSFSTLSLNPNDPLARQRVIDAASNAAQSINTTARNIGAATAEADKQTGDVIRAINSDITQLQALNQQRRTSPGSAHDAGIDAQVYAKLEDLSQYANVQSLQQPDGTVNVYLGGQTALLVSTHAYTIGASPSQGAIAIVDSNNQEITTQISSGKLAGLIGQRNKILPGYAADINTLAQSLADTVNGQLNSGVDTSGAGPSTDLFTYDAVVGAGATLAVTGIQANQIAAALPSAPGGNGNALALAQLATAKSINGLSFGQFYGGTAARFGTDLSNAAQNTQTSKSLLAQVQGYRQQISGVSLDQQAALLVQFQQAYQAAGEMFKVLNTLMQDTISMLR